MAQVDPFDLVGHTQFFKQDAGGTRIFRCTDAVEFMKRSLKFKTTADKACGKTARDIVLLQNQAGLAGI